MPNINHFTRTESDTSKYFNREIRMTAQVKCEVWLLQTEVTTEVEDVKKQGRQWQDSEPISVKMVVLSHSLGEEKNNRGDWFHPLFPPIFPEFLSTRGELKGKGTWRQSLKQQGCTFCTPVEWEEVLSLTFGFLGFAKAGLAYCTAFFSALVTVLLVFRRQACAPSHCPLNEVVNC